MEPIPLPPPLGGVRPDLDPENVSDDELIAAENVIRRDGDFRVRPGFVTLANDINDRPMAYLNYSHADGTIRIVQVTDNGWYQLVSNVWDDITGTPLTADADDQVILRTFSKAGETWLLGTNGADPLYVWDGDTGTYVAAGGSPPRARCMMVVFDRVILGNLLSGGTISPVAFDVSENRDFDSGWGTVLVALLADTEGPIMSMQEMGTLQGAILKSDAVCMLIAQGGSDPFRVQWVKSGISGPAAPRLSEKQFDGSIVMVGIEGMISVFDGANVISLPYAIQKHIARTANLEKLYRGWMYYDRDRREMWVIYPLVGSDEPNGGVLLNMGTLACYPIRFGGGKAMTAGGRIITTSGLTIGDLTGPISSLSGLTIGQLATTSVLRKMVMGEVGGQTYEENGYTDGASTIPFFWQPPVRGTAETFTTVKRIRHRFKSSVGSQVVNVRVGKRNEGGTVTYGAAHPIQLSSPLRKVTGHRVTGEYLALQFDGDGSAHVNYQGSTAYLSRRGKR